MNWMVDQLIQLAGSALILVAFVGAQTGRLDQKSRVYLLANALGSTALAVEAAYYRQWGFLLLEGAWAIISVLGIVSAALPAGMRESIGDLPGSQTTDSGDRSQIAQEPLPRVQRGIEAGDCNAVFS